MLMPNHAMASKLLLPLLLLAAGAATPALAFFDILQTLYDKSQYAAFSQLLMDTQLADDINRQRAVTVLVVSDAAVRPFSSLSFDALRQALSNHVVLNYFDPIKLDEMQNRTAILGTLLSATDHRLGLINYTKHDDGQMYFGTPGAPCASKLIKVIAARPYSFSLMEVSEAILPPNIAAAAAGAAVKPFSDTPGLAAAEDVVAFTPSEAPSEVPY